MKKESKFKMQIQKSTNRFSVTELIVVLLIIGLIVGISLTALSSSRLRARDIHRGENMTDVQTVLDLYFERFGKFPDHDCNKDRAGAPSAKSAVCANSFNKMLADLRKEGYLKDEDIVDPRDATKNNFEGSAPSADSDYWYGYDVGGNGTNYQLRYYNEEGLEVLFRP